MHCKKFNMVLVVLLLSISIPANSGGVTKLLSKLIGVTVVVAAGTSVVYMLKQHGLKEIDDSSGIEKASSDAEKARERGEEEYQIKVCLDEDGNEVALPRSFKQCPYGDFEVVDGPLLVFPQS